MKATYLLKKISDMENSDGNKAPFDKYFSVVKECFQEIHKFHSLQENACANLKWPKDPGVYVVWKISANPTPNESAQVVYIGMTGKFNTAGKCAPKQGLHHRRIRWTPYCFAEKGEQANNFCFGPKYEKGESRDKAPKNGYDTCLPINNIRVDCFVFNRDWPMAPSFLEALLLQGYLEQYESLPAGNNAF